jgi:hypothetical protein
LQEKQAEAAWNLEYLSVFVYGGGNQRELVRWPVAGPFESILTSSEQVDKLRKLEVH